jgi:hypothetical protein
VIAGDPDDVRARLRSHGAVLVTVSTGSMAPTLRPGDSVLVRAPVVHACAGDVALLASGKLLTLHRLIGRVGAGSRARWVHAGDAPGAAAGLCRDDELLAIAELARQRPALPSRARLSAIAIARALLSRFIAMIASVAWRGTSPRAAGLRRATPAGGGRGRVGQCAAAHARRPARPVAGARTARPCARLAVACGLALVAGCKPKAPPAPPPARVVEVRVVDRSPPGSVALDPEAIRGKAAKAIAESSGLAVTDGGVPGGAAFKLRIEVLVQPGEDPAQKRPMMRALVTVRLAPQEGVGLLAYDQTAVAEGGLDAKGDGGVPAAAQALAERAVLDVVKGVGARVKLAGADPTALNAALDGADEDLRLEALRVAGERRERTVVPAVIRLLKNEDRDVRDRAVGTLAAIGDPRAVRPLTEVARFRDLGDLPMVLDALATIGGEEARAYLEFVASGHENTEMRELAKKSLSYWEKRARRDLE